ncbi:MAG: hypothetical protein ACJASQ_000500 [Crocinitomicaceae bacterium]|jgi:hypothetical protein
MSINSFGQKRIGLSLDSRFENLTIGFNYYHVVKGNWFLSTGAYIGIIGSTAVINNPDLLNNNFSIESPYQNVDLPRTNDGKSFDLLDYGTSANGFGLNLGFGYFHEFNVTHGIRTNVNYRMGIGFVRTLGRYISPDSTEDVYDTSWNTHDFHAVSLELYHTIRVYPRLTFYYGIKAPYYFNYGGDKFAPKSSRDLLDGIEADVSLGFTYVVGNCD